MLIKWDNLGKVFGPVLNTCSVCLNVSYRKWQPTPVFLPGEFYVQRSLAGYSPSQRDGYRYDWVTNTLIYKIYKNNNHYYYMKLTSLKDLDAFKIIVLVNLYFKKTMIKNY